MQLINIQKIEDAKLLALKALANLSYKNVLEKNYSIDICGDNEFKMHQVWIALKLLYSWKQSNWGNTTNYTNYSNLEDIKNTISWINKECR